MKSNFVSIIFLSIDKYFFNLNILFIFFPVPFNIILFSKNSIFSKFTSHFLHAFDKKTKLSPILVFLNLNSSSSSTEISESLISNSFKFFL